jgi:hypothetical protein
VTKSSGSLAGQIEPTLLCGTGKSRGRQPNSAAGKSRGVKIARAPDHLHVDHGDEPVRRRVGDEHSAGYLRQRAVRERLGEHSTDQLAYVSDIKLHHMRDGPTEIGIAGGRRIDELLLEVRPLHGHEVPGVGAAERAMHSLAVLQNGIGNFDGAAHRFPTHRIE